MIFDYDRHGDDVAKILLSLIREGRGSWDSIVRTVKAKYRVEDWRDVRSVLQLLLNADDVVRCPSVHVEIYVPTGMLRDDDPAVKAFNDALDILAKGGDDAWGSDEQVGSENRAFDVARENGWDADRDEDFMQWAAKATSRELLTEGFACYVKSKAPVRES